MIDKLNRIVARGWCLLGVLLCIFMMGFALLLQHVWGLQPCPLCIFQRIAVIATFIVLIPGVFQNPKRWGGIVYGVLGIITSLAGVALAARHVYIQHLPPDAIPSCSPGIDYLMQVLPWQTVVAQVLEGSGECAQIHGIFLGITLPGWTGIGFFVLFLISLFLFISSIHRTRRKKSSRLL
ncbi:Disulfide bond formation protein B [Halomonadaceae bacterium LMG 33818]|uniref:disulfide bond formation protein B n=1 Tax=Cernens ardua TaxID=3402176 RepID=UPI003EDBC530